MELERSIEGGFDPYGDPELLEQWTLCIANIMREQQDKAAELQGISSHYSNNSNDNNNNSGKFHQQTWALYASGTTSHGELKRNVITHIHKQLRPFPKYSNQ